MLQIKSGRLAKPVKTVLYGVEGVGKSSLAACFPQPLFLDTEGSTTRLDVDRVDGFTDWEDLISTIREVAQTPGCCQTMVVDTADWAEQMAIAHLLKKHGVDGLESFGFGKGYTYLGEEFTRFLRACDEVIASGRHVVITAHSKVRKQEVPEEYGAFDHYELKLTRQCAPLLKEWPDLLLFLNFKTLVIGDDKKGGSKKATGGKRVMYTTRTACWDAKNRFGLPDELPLDFNGIAHLFSSTQTAAPAQPAPAPQSDTKALFDELAARMDRDAITEEALRTLVAGKGHYPIDTPISDYHPDFLRQWLFPHWDKITTMITTDPEYVPF